MRTLEKLCELYGNISKHSNYQVLPSRLQSLLGNAGLEVKSRYERERLDYLISRVRLPGSSALDIGGNSGFFTFEALEAGAREVTYVEGNKAHSDFVALAAQVLGYTEQLEVVNTYYDFSSSEETPVDICFLLNVLHHVGDDYGDKRLAISAAKEEIARQLVAMADNCRELIFQLGFCWKGDRNQGLFTHGTKREMIDFIASSVRGAWHIRSIAVPIRGSHGIKYVDLDGSNIARDDSLGEFLNRPLFIMSSMALNSVPGASGRTEHVADDR